MAPRSQCGVTDLDARVKEVRARGVGWVGGVVRGAGGAAGERGARGHGGRAIGAPAQSPPSAVSLL